MSASPATTPVNSGASTPVLVEKKPPTSLPAKYAKFIQFGYFLVNKLNTESDTPLIDDDLLFNTLHLFEDINTQQSFVQEFFDSSKFINKNLRKIVQNHKKAIIKANQPKKVRAPRVKKVKNTDDDNNEELPVTLKKTRAKKTKINTSEDQLVNELVELATKKDNAIDAVNQLLSNITPINDTKLTKVKTIKTIKQPAVQQQPVVNIIESDVNIIESDNSDNDEQLNNIKVKKTKKITVQQPQLDELELQLNNLNLNELPKKDKKIKDKKVKQPELELPKKDKKTKKVKQPVEPVVEPVVETVVETVKDGSLDDDELQVSVFEYNDTQYLIDDDNNVYDFVTQDVIGRFVDNKLVLN
jgi:hypothetical protein